MLFSRDDAAVHMMSERDSRWYEPSCEGSEEAMSVNRVRSVFCEVQLLFRRSQFELDVRLWMGVE